MRKVLVLLFIVSLCSYAFSAEQVKSVQETKTQEQIKIGYVDLQRALNESEAGKKAKTELETEIKEKQTVIDKEKTAYEKVRAELERQAIALSEDAKKAKEEALQKMERDLERLIADSNEMIQRKQREKEVAILKDLEGVIEKFGKDGSYTLILLGDVILYADEARTDLTDKVITLYNELRASPEKKAK